MRRRVEAEEVRGKDFTSIEACIVRRRMYKQEDTPANAEKMHVTTSRFNNDCTID